MSSGRWKRRRTHNDSDDDHDGDAVTPPPHYAAGIQSDMLVEDNIGNTGVDQFFDQPRQSGGIQPREHNPQPSSLANFLGTGGVFLGETSPSAPQQHRPDVRNMIIGGNSHPVNNDPLRRLDDPASAPVLKQQEKHSEPFTGVGRYLTSSPMSQPAPESTVYVPMHRDPPSVGHIVYSSLASTYVRVKLPDGNLLTGDFNYHHTIADIHSFIDACRPGGSSPYQLVIAAAGSIPARVLNDHTQTIEQAQLFNSVVHLRF